MLPWHAGMVAVMDNDDHIGPFNIGNPGACAPCTRLPSTQSHNHTINASPAPSAQTALHEPLALSCTGFLLPI